MNMTPPDWTQLTATALTETAPADPPPKPALATWLDHANHRELQLTVDGTSGEARLRDVTVTLSSLPGISEIFLTAPNFNDIEQAHPLQTLYQGLHPEHPDALFGRQWMFSPPPLVFPMRCGDQWYGIALAAPLGLNHFSGWTYRPVKADRTIYYPAGATVQGTAGSLPSSVDFIIHYDGQCSESGHIASLLILTEG